MPPAGDMRRASGEPHGSGTPHSQGDAAVPNERGLPHGALGGLRIVVTRAGTQADELCETIRRLGGLPVSFPTIAILPPESTVAMDAALRSLDSYDWVVFTSANGVRSVVDRLSQLGLSTDVLSLRRVAATGRATADVLVKAGIAVTAVPDEYKSSQIPRAIAPARGECCLLLRADIANDSLPRALSERGAKVDDVIVYRTVAVKPAAAQLATLRAGVDVITFTSPSTVRGFMDAVGPGWRDQVGDPKIASIGPVTSAAVVEFGYHVAIEATEYTTAGLLRAIHDHIAHRTET